MSSATKELEPLNSPRSKLMLWLKEWREQAEARKFEKAQKLECLLWRNGQASPYQWITDS